MSSNVKVAKGDRIKVVLEGTVDQADGDGEIYFAYEDNEWGGSFYNNWSSVVSIEVVKKPVAVGDTITSAELVAGEWKTGTLVHDEDVNGEVGYWMRNRSGWVSSGYTSEVRQQDFFDGFSADGFRIIYLP